jgi:WD40 repeat protein
LFKQIEQVFVLSGHEDWIRSITIQKSSKAALSCIVYDDFFSAPFQWFVATCSQDNYIRIWQLSFDENNNNQTNVDSAALKLKRNSFALKISGRLSCKSIYLSRLFHFFN